jgi:hypothetical protein
MHLDPKPPVHAELLQARYGNLRPVPRATLAIVSVKQGIYVTFCVV